MLDKLKAFSIQIPKVAKVLIPLATVLLIGFFMPRSARFKYEFAEGQVWRNGDLYAPFDFTLYKSDATILAEKGKIEQDFSPYFIWDTEIAATVAAQFNSSFSSQVENEKNSTDYQEVFFHQNDYRRVGLGLINIIYNAGVVGNDTVLDGQAPSFVINVVRGNETYRKTLGNVFNIRSAYEFITDSLPHSSLRNPEFILPVLEQVIVPNLIFSDSLTQKYKQRELAGISSVVGSVKAGDLVLANNTRISPEDYQKLDSLRKHYEAGQNGKYTKWLIFLGNLILLGVILLVFFQFIRNYNREEYGHFGDLLMIFMMPLFFGFLSIFVVNNSGINPYFIPFAIVPLVARSFFPIRLSLLLHLVVVVVSTFILGQGFDFVLVQVVAGIVALIVGKETRYWGQFFVSIGLILLTYLVMIFVLNFVKSGEMIWSDLGWLAWLMLNGLLLLIAYPLIPLFGKIFGRITPIQLAELADFNHVLLKELSLKAPGTFQHSLQVANLAEAAANAIGANALLVKAGALFHDIGKMKNPSYFIENQKGSNPHDKISAKESAAIIIGHVVEGEKLAKKHNLPKEIIQLILTHHGSTRVEYFYRTEVNEHGEDAVNPKDFTYPGPAPQTKEEVILMIADSMEAASHSLKEPNEKNLDELIQKVLQFKKDAHQFDHSDITFADFDTVVKTIRKTLHSIYHIRVEYPD